MVRSNPENTVALPIPNTETPSQQDGVFSLRLSQCEVFSGPGRASAWALALALALVLACAYAFPAEWEWALASELASESALGSESA